MFFRQAAGWVSGATGFSNALHSVLFRRAVIFAVFLREPWFPCVAKAKRGLCCVWFAGSACCFPARPRVYAQVGEWLKPTDCKSVPPSEVRRFESFPVHQIAEAELNTRRKFAFSLGAFLVLALLSWNTMSGDPIALHDAKLGIDVSISFRTATVSILGLLAALTTVNFLRATAEERRQGSEERE